MPVLIAALGRGAGTGLLEHQQRHNGDTIHTPIAKTIRKAERIARTTASHGVPWLKKTPSNGSHCDPFVNGRLRCSFVTFMSR